MITEKLLSQKDLTWIDVTEPRDEDFERLKSEFSLPYLLVQDCLRPEHLPKFEESDEGHFLMLRSYDHEALAEATTVQELTRKIALFITENRLVTIHRVELEYLDKTAGKAEKLPPRSLQSLVHQIILATIRTYEEPIERLQDAYAEFENDVLVKETLKLSSARVYEFRRQTFILKRLLRLSNDALMRFREFWEDHPSMVQDLQENIDQLYYQLDEVSDGFEHLLEIHIALNDQRANDVMKLLTVFSSIMLPLNFIASFYGMNFTHLPGLDSPRALGLITLFMGSVSLSAIIYFYRKGWFRTRD